MVGPDVAEVLETVVQDQITRPAADVDAVELATALVRAEECLLAKWERGRNGYLRKKTRTGPVANASHD